MKYAPWIGWLLAIIFIFLYYKSCQPPKNPVTTEKGDSILQAAIDKSSKDSLQAIYFFDLYSIWKNKFDSLYNETRNKEKQIIISAGKVKTLIDSIKYYKSVNDTLSQLSSCGDLILEDSVLLDLLFEAKVSFDSLQIANAEERVIVDSLLRVKDIEISSLKLALTSLHLEYTNAIAEVNIEKKKAKTNNVWAKVTTVTTAILSAILILKK